jgi:hypothetical protein
MVYSKTENALEQFRNTRRLFGGIKGGLFLRKTPLECVLPVYTNSETAIEFAAQDTLAVILAFDGIVTPAVLRPPSPR